MMRMAGGTRVINFGRRSAGDAEAPINHLYDKKTCIAGDLRALKINPDRSV